MDDPRRVFTIGHSNRSLDEFVALLDAHRIEVLADVRAFPGSRRLPHFGQDRLAPALEDHGIAYHHVRELGGRRRGDDDADPAAGDAWRNASFRAYAQYAQSPTYRHALERLEELASGDGRLAYMCSEAVPWRCHRWLVSDTLVARGWSVFHLLDRDAPRTHLMSPFAQVADGRVRWPGPESSAKLRLGPRVGAGTGARR